MAKFDQGGGCACGLYRTCECKQEKDETRTFKKPEEKRYVLIREGNAPIILEGRDELIKSFNSNLKSDEDQYYELGPEVELKVSISVKSKETVYRGGADVR